MVQHRARAVLLVLLAPHLLSAPGPLVHGAEQDRSANVSATSLRGKVMTGYQGWFRCPQDGSKQGWVHWSRDAQRLAPNSLTFEMWPDMSDYSAPERFAAPGFSHPDGQPAYLFSSDNRRTVLRHFEWLRDYGIDGVWLQHFVVDLPGGPMHQRYASRLRVVEHVAAAAEKTARVWALTYDIAGMPNEQIFDVLTKDWKKMVDGKIIESPRYVRHDKRPVVQIFGFYRDSPGNAMTPALANRLIEFFQAPGPYSAYLVGGGDWDWRHNPDPEWQAMYRRFEAYVPWNIGNYTTDGAGEKRASTDRWRADRKASQDNGTLWIPTIYPGFCWDNLQQKPPGSTDIPRRRGRFLWEQFHELASMQVDTVFVAMFDEVDEGTAIFKVTSQPPVQGHFAGYEGLPSDEYLRITSEGIRMLRKQRPVAAEIPTRP